MSRILYTSDLHFLHMKVAQARGYPGPWAHDAALIERFNDFVQPQDQLWILGDLGVGKLELILSKVAELHGEKHLVLGNHDAGHPMHKRAYTKMSRYLEVFNSVQLHGMHKFGGRTVLLSHYPYAGAGDGPHSEVERGTQWRLPDQGLYLIHGHVHDGWTTNGRMLNVGVDVSPVPVEGARVASMITNLEMHGHKDPQEVPIG